MIVSNPATPHVVDVSSGILPDNGVTHAISILRRSHPNMLLVGDDDAVERLLERVCPFLVRPIACWRPRENATRPTTSFRTLIVRGIDDLRLSQCASLTDVNADVQVISTTRAPLFPAVQRGAFPDGLYYRLNVVVLDLSAVHES
jgi:hypothetical protein